MGQSEKQVAALTVDCDEDPGGAPAGLWRVLQRVALKVQAAC